VNKWHWGVGRGEEEFAGNFASSEPDPNTVLDFACAIRCLIGSLLETGFGWGKSAGGKRSAQQRPPALAR